MGCLDGRVLSIDIYGITYGSKNADGILLGGFDMVNVQKNLSPDLIGSSALKRSRPIGSGVKYRLSPVRTVNNCHRASLKSMLSLTKLEP